MELAGRTLILDGSTEIDPSYEAKSPADGSPFWAYLWPSASALAQVIAQGPPLAGRRVLDLGCGLGLAGLAAAAQGATTVLADIRPEAVALARRNAAKNDLRVEAIELDWDAPPPDLGLFDGIFAADVLYDDGMLSGVLRFIRRHLHPEGLALVADPRRVQTGGLLGAARLHGLVGGSVSLAPGVSLVGGVELTLLRRRR